MERGRTICNELKKVRRRIAEENEIPLEIKECTYDGPCRGTCPRCEAEVQYLENELEKRIRLGKVATVGGVALGLAACTHGGTLSQQADDTMLVGDALFELHENDTLDVPPPPDPEVPDSLQVMGIIEDEGFVVDTSPRPNETLSYLPSAKPDLSAVKEQEPTCSTVYCEDLVIVRGESGSVVTYGTVHRRRFSRLIVPQTTMESFKEDEEREARKALQYVVEYDEVDGKKVVKHQPTAEQ